MTALEDAGGRMMRKLSLGLMAGLLALAALAVALSALYLWLLAVIAPPAALGIVAGILAILAVAAWGLAHWRVPASGAAPEADKSSSPDIAMALPETADIIRRAVIADPRAAMLGAVAAGYVVDSSPGMDIAMLNRIIGQMQR